MALIMKSACEACGASTEADGIAFICSYECTYCQACADRLPHCPNCQGELLQRPRRIPTPRAPG